MVKMVELDMGELGLMKNIETSVGISQAGGS